MTILHVGNVDINLNMSKAMETKEIRTYTYMYVCIYVSLCMRVCMHTYECIYHCINLCMYSYTYYKYTQRGIHMDSRIIVDLFLETRTCTIYWCTKAQLFFVCCLLTYMRNAAYDYLSRHPYQVGYDISTIYRY